MMNIGEAGDGDDDKAGDDESAGDHDDDENNTDNESDVCVCVCSSPLVMIECKKNRNTL